MSPREVHEPSASNLLGDALGESRVHFRKLLASLDQLIDSDKKEEARRHLPKLEALGQELHRMLNPSDPVEGRLRSQIDRDLNRVQKALKKGWGGTIGKGLLAVAIAAVLGIAALIGIFTLAFG